MNQRFEVWECDFMHKRVDALDEGWRIVCITPMAWSGWITPPQDPDSGRSVIHNEARVSRVGVLLERVNP